MARKTTRLSAARGALDLATQGLLKVLDAVEGTHSAIAQQPFAVGRAVPGVQAGFAAVQPLHDGITKLVYQSIRLGTTAVGRAGDFALRAGEGQLSPDAANVALAPHPQRDAVVSAISGFVGDSLLRRRNPLSIRMGFWRDGRPLTCTAEGLAEAIPQPQRRILIFVHGLACNESVWALYRDQQQPYGEQLEAAGMTAIYLRYNSGLHISANGRSLSRLLTRLVAAWPVPVDNISVVGHSMGGLVARSAAWSAQKQGCAWLGKLDQVICLGSPHTGAPLARAAAWGAKAGQNLSLTRAAAQILDLRSHGVRDLSHGFVADEDWRQRPADALNADARTPIPRAPGVRYRFVAATLSALPGGAWDQTLGDGLVRVDSAAAGYIADADTVVLARAHHMQLLNHSAIAGLLHDWLGTAAIGQDPADVTTAPAA